MSVFILETEVVSSVASTINSLVSQVSSLSSSVGGYDTSCEDNFDFASAKYAISENIEACSTKISNTSTILENVVNSHTQLQNSMKFSYGGAASSSSSSGVSSFGNSSSGGVSSGVSSSGSSSSVGVSSGVSSSGSNSSVGVSSGVSSSGSNSSRGVSSGVSSSVGASFGGNSFVSGSSGGRYSREDYNEEHYPEERYSSIVHSVEENNNDLYSMVGYSSIVGSGAGLSQMTSKDSINKVFEKEKSEEKGVNDEIITEGSNIQDVSTEGKSELNKVGYAYANKNNLPDEPKVLFESEDFAYDSDGYAKVGERFVIACDSSVGEVGDVIRFTKNDGSVVECVVGINSESDKYQNTINFIVDKEKTDSLKSNDVINNILNDNNKIENIKEITEIDTVIPNDSVDYNSTETVNNISHENTSLSDFNLNGNMDKISILEEDE